MAKFAMAGDIGLETRGGLGGGWGLLWSGGDEATGGLVCDAGALKPEGVGVGGYDDEGEALRL